MRPEEEQQGSSQSRSEFHVVNPMGFHTVRVYTEEEHGEKAGALAMMFASKNDYKVIKK